MDRSYWFDHGQYATGEKTLFQQGGIRIYDGEDRVTLYCCVQYIQ